MNIRHWGIGLRAFFGMTLVLPLLAFGGVTWFTLSIIEDFIAVADRAILELPAEKGAEIEGLFRQVLDRAEVIAVAVPAVAMALIALTLAYAVVRLFSKLTGTCLFVFNAAQQIQSFGSGLSQSAEKLWKETEDSGRAVEQSVSHLEQLASGLQRSASEVSEADKLARVTVGEASRGENELRAVVVALEELDSHNKKLDEVINAFDSIAFQTNILAVNAAVEAARAGEQGRGFGIVADAVKSLAQQSAVSAKNIADLIQQSSDTSKRAFDGAQAGAHCLSEVATQAKRSQDVIHKIADSTQEMTLSVERLAQAFTQIDCASDHILSAVEHSVAANEQLNQRSGELYESVEDLSGMLLMTDAIPERNVEAPPAHPVQQSQANLHVPKLTLSKRAESKMAEKPAQAGKPSGASTGSEPQQSELFARVRARAIHSKAEGFARPNRTAVRQRARDVIPFEGEAETEPTSHARYGTTSGF